MDYVSIRSDTRNMRDLAKVARGAMDFIEREAIGKVLGSVESPFSILTNYR